MNEQTTTQVVVNPFAGFFDGISKIMGDFLPYVPVLITAGIFIGGVLLLAGKKGREYVKDHAIWFILGVALVLGATVYGTYLVSTFTF